MMRLLQVFVSSLAFGLPMLASAAAIAERPNFLVILCDDLGYGDLSCYGHPAIKTPHLDQLAAEGLRLTACYSASPVCSPSRVGLLTGRTPSRAGVYDWIPDGHSMHLRASERTVATLLQQSGYTTCHVGKWHCNGKFNSPEQPQPNDHGFEHWFSTQNNAAPSHENPMNFVRNGEPVGPLEGYSCEIVAKEAIYWLQELRDPSRPYFLFVCFHEPHEPIASPADLVEEYSEADKEGEALYYANVSNMDRAVGTLLEALDQLQLRDNTLVFFTSDNGPETLRRYPGAWRSHGSAGPLRGQKLHLYEGGIRVPGILRFPGRIEPGQVTDEPVCGLDVLPTLCELADIEIPRDRPLDGSSFTPVFTGQPVRRTQPLFWHYYRAAGLPKTALRDGDYVILGHLNGPMLPPGGGVRPGDREIIRSAELVGYELYNVREDLTQTSDLADERPDVLQSLAQPLRRLYQQIQSEPE